MNRRMLLTFLFTACFAGCCAGAAWLYLHPRLPEAGTFFRLLLGMALFFGIPAAILWARFRRR